MDWLNISRGNAPLIIAVPHAGTVIPDDIAARFHSAWLGRKDADFYVDQLYDFARDADVTLISTDISRSVIDVNRDPSGASLYPGMATTGLCPLTSFDGEPLYSGAEPDEAEIAQRRAKWFEPYHGAIQDELDRLRQTHRNVVLYDAHSIRYRIPRLFEGDLPMFNIGTNGGATCDERLQNAVVEICEASGLETVLNARFKGGWTTRHYGRPEDGIHAIQMELAMQGYLDEPETPTPENWPTPYAASRAAQTVSVLKSVIGACLNFAGPLSHGDKI
nr:N-formylglutamate deformylase [Ponticaulis sp.]|tara:strand:- start:560 stop:1387 length:828 start_codon:yes stop_codon:yes gene_type:complete